MSKESRMQSVGWNPQACLMRKKTWFWQAIEAAGMEISLTNSKKWRKVKPSRLNLSGTLIYTISSIKIV
nr:hypothetical protein [Peribacillus alkalitolerans]